MVRYSFVAFGGLVDFMGLNTWIAAIIVKHDMQFQALTLNDNEVRSV